MALHRFTLSAAKLLQETPASSFKSLSYRWAALNPRLLGACAQKSVICRRWDSSAALDRKIRTAADPSLYDEALRKSIENPEDFWAEAAEDVVWTKKWDKVLDDSQSPFTKWFVGGELNTCYNAVDRHVDAGNGTHPAFIYDSPVTKTIKTITYRDLQVQVSRFAGVLSKLGVGKGDRVLIYMPMIPQAVIAMLASARLGALHSLVFGGFASKELATRISHAKPKVVVSANCGIEPNRIIDYKTLLDGALELSDCKVENCVIFNRTSMEEFKPAPLIRGRDHEYMEAMAEAEPHDCVPVSATDPVYVLYTSGTTGTPKAVVRPSGGHAVVLNWSMKNLYGLDPKEGKPVGTPDPSTYYRIINDHKVKAMFVAPTAMRALRREDPDGEYSKGYAMKDFKYMYVAGEYCDHETMEWIREQFKTPVLDNWWQTETGSAISATCVGLGNDLYPPPGVAGKPVPGWNMKVIRPDMTECEPGELGAIVAKLPLPPACFSTLFNNPERFSTLYFSRFPGYYDTMDAGYMDENGNIAVMSRSDDVINVAGHRLSTGQLEEAILEHEDVAESAVVGMPDDLKGQVPIGLVVLQKGVDRPEEIVIKEIINSVRQHVGPVASFKDAVIVKKLPKTRSGKVARNTIAAIVAGKEYKIPVTIEDASVYPAMEKAFRDHGYPKVK